MSKLDFETWAAIVGLSFFTCAAFWFLVYAIPILFIGGWLGSDWVNSFSLWVADVMMRFWWAPSPFALFLLRKYVE